MDLVVDYLQVVVVIVCDVNWKNVDGVVVSVGKSQGRIVKQVGDFYCVLDDDLIDV